MKACIACKHFLIDLGQPGYSAMTPGTDAIMECRKGRFIARGDGYDDAILTQLQHGTDCPHFEISDLAKSKGWPE